MRVLVAPDKFKGSMSAGEVADRLAEGLTGAGVDAVPVPLADGGEGSVDAALRAGYSVEMCPVIGAAGQRHRAKIAVRGHAAVVESANTCGLPTLPAGMLAPMTASSYGLGEAILHAARRGARTIVVALGGSASTDGGIGMLAALGYRFHDAHGETLLPSSYHLHRVQHVVTDRAVSLGHVELLIASDVTNPLTGPSGTAAVFARQKGATLTEIDHLEDGLANLVTAASRSGWPAAPALAAAAGAGAAGGCGFAAMLLGGTVVSGAEYFLELLDFDTHLHGADLVVTGEGQLDTQTLSGKLPAVVAQRASPIPVIAVVGRNTLTSGADIFAEVFSVADFCDEKAAHNRGLTAQILGHIGAHIGQQMIASGAARNAADIGQRAASARHISS